MTSKFTNLGTIFLYWAITLIFFGLVAASTRSGTPARADSNGVMNSSKYGILGRPAPELRLSNWIDGQGQPMKNVHLPHLRGKVVYLYFFQHWCPGCHSHGFPTLQTIARRFENDERVVLLAVQTAFEGKHINTAEQLRRNQIDYDLKIPMAHDDGGDRSRALPQTMIDYRSGGTPWTVIIDPKGNVAYNQFHIDANLAIKIIEALSKDAQA